MKTRRILTLAVVLGCLQFSGCTTWKATDGTPLVESKFGYQYTAPTGWYLSPFKGLHGARRFTRDGSTLQSIGTVRVKHKKAFQAIEKESNADMLPQELAETYVANLKAQLQNDRLDILENEPAMLGGKQGVKLTMEYRTDSGLRYRTIHYAAVTADGMYVVFFQAPTLHYYDRYIGEFEDSMTSFNIS